MAEIQSFRSSLNGFNREDVVRYIESLNNQHRQTVNVLQEEIAELQRQLQRQQEESAKAVDYSDAIAECREEMEQQSRAAQEQAAEYEKIISELEKQVQELKISGGKRDLEQEELIIYRRAERTERMAKERVNQMFEKANAVLRDVQDQLAQRSHVIEETAADVVQKLSTVQFAFHDGAEVAQNAIAALQEMHLEVEE